MDRRDANLPDASDGSPGGDVTAGAGRVVVVTDSTGYLSPELLAKHGVEVVPLQVVIDGVPRTEGAGSRRTRDEGDGERDQTDGAGERGHQPGLEIGPAEVAEALRRHVPVSTSRPSPHAFSQAYQAAAERGASHVVSVHLSGSLSGTVDAAWLAANDAPLPVEVVDSRSVGMGLGFAVLAAAEAAARGESPERVVAAAKARATSSSAFFYVDTLEYLRRGGRVGAASAMVGTALAIKPLLHLVDGEIEPLEKVRTAARALARLEDLAVQCAGTAAVDVAVHHLDNATRAEVLASRLSERLTGVRRLVVSEIGAVIGAHAGPGMLAVVVSPH